MRIINRNRIASITLALVLAIMLVIPNVVNAAEAPVELESASNFAVLAGSTITNTGPTTISGNAGADIGLHPGTEITGLETTTGSSITAGSITVSGNIHIADDVAKTAKADLLTAYNNSAGRTPTTTIATELGGQTLTPGVYTSAAGTFGITGTLTLDGEGDPNAVFIFVMGSTLDTASASEVELINRATSCQVYWVVGSSATLGTNSEFVGTIMAQTSITATTGAKINGRLLASTGAVTLDTNTITNDTCNATVVPDSEEDEDRNDRDDQESVEESEPTEESEPIEEPETVVEPDTTVEPETDVPVTTDVPETDVPVTTDVPRAPYTPETPNEPRLPATGAASTTVFSGLGASFLLAGFALLKNKK